MKDDRKSFLSFSFFYVCFPSSNWTRSPRAAMFTLKHTWTCLPCSTLSCTCIVRSHAHCTVLYVLETRAPGYAEKTRFWEELGAEEDWFIVKKEMGAKEGFLFYEESLLGRNWVQRKDFLLSKESLLGEGIGYRGRISSSVKNHY